MEVNPNDQNQENVEPIQHKDKIQQQESNEQLINVPDKNQLQIVPLEPSFDERNKNLQVSIQLPTSNDNRENVNQMNANMTMSKIPNIFGNSTFNNCTINFQMPE